MLSAGARHRGETRTSGAARPASPPLAGAAGLHEAAWLAWAAAACVAVLLTSNLLYLSLACLTGLAIYLSLLGEGRGRAYALLLKVGVFLALLSLPLNVLTGSTGLTVLARLPQVSFPGWLGGVTFGGEVTGEALAYAGSRALSLTALLLFVAAFNAGVDHFRLLRLLPAVLFQAGVVLTVALLLVPQTVAQARAVREAQRLRGRRLRGAASLVALAVPVLAGALERSVQRAESLDARGFGRLEPGPRGLGADRLAAAAGLVGLCLAALGAFAYFYEGDISVLALPSLAAGAALVTAAVHRQGRRLRRTHYRPEPWRPRDRWVAGLSLASLALLLALRAAGSGDLTYLPYPELTAPSFHPLAALAFILLLAPLLAAPTSAAPKREVAP